MVKENNRRRRLSPLRSGVKGDKYGATPLGRTRCANTEADQIPTPVESHQTRARRQDRWAVVLFDDSHHSMDYVVWALLKTVPELSVADASLIMLEAHNTGKGIVTLCGREQAVKHRDALRILQLRCEIEPGW